MTKGHPELSDFIGEQSTLQYSASLEKHSNHPIAEAITDAYDQEYLEVSDFQVLLGKGIKGTIQNKTVYVGSLNLVKELNLNAEAYDYETYLHQGKSVFFTIIDQE
ncbi:MAG TPA: heavy metal translocating P-type ATPase, partial [Acholeplasmataceae bacterium]|nr:heavy metal translocating P-type ATPase [Acholeplasmataceae bacterium]